MRKKETELSGNAPKLGRRWPQPIYKLSDINRIPAPESGLFRAMGECGAPAHSGFGAPIALMLSSNGSLVFSSPCFPRRMMLPN